MKITPPQLRTVMSPFPYAVDINAPLAEAAAIFAEHDIHHLPVTRDGHLIGMLTAGRIAVHPRPHVGLCVRDLYAPDPYIVDLDERLGVVLATMATRHLDCAIVIRHGKLAGVFTANDACRAFADLLERLDPPPGDGDAAA